METLPGIYPDMDEAEYHGHPALSASGIKTLAQPGGPAVTRLSLPLPPR